MTSGAGRSAARGCRGSRKVRPQHRSAGAGPPAGTEPAAGYPRRPATRSTPAGHPRPAATQGYTAAPPPPPPTYPGPAPAAPSGWGAAAPPAMERPSPSRAGLGLFIAESSWVWSGPSTSSPDFADLVDQVRAQHESSAALSPSPRCARALVDRRGHRAGHRRAGVADDLVRLAGPQLGADRALGRGRPRRRQRTGGAGHQQPVRRVLQTLGIFQLLITVVAVVLLALKPSNEWYRYRRWLRATGQGR